MIYLIISLLYRCILVAYDFREQRQTFELLCIYADRFSSSIPLSFLTGFYVTQVVNRWWEQFMALPWPDQLAFKLLAFVPGNVSNPLNLIELFETFKPISNLFIIKFQTFHLKVGETLM